MKDEYSLSIDRPGYGDLPELARCSDPVAVAELVRALLCLHDASIRAVNVTVCKVSRIDPQPAERLSER